MFQRATIAIAGLFALLAACPAGAQSQPRPSVALAAFSYEDTSGEPGDRAAEHAARVVLFRAALGRQLAAGRHFAASELPCASADRCTAATTGAEALLADARRAGADFLAFGNIHKMSTLVGWGRVDVVDTASGKLVFDRVISFRGDSDEAFERAAAFVAKDMARTLAPDGQAVATGRGIR